MSSAKTKLGRFIQIINDAGSAYRLTFDSSVSTPSIQQESVGSAVGQSMGILAQGNNSATLSAGTLAIGGGVNSGAGPSGILQLLYGGNARWTLRSQVMRIHQTTPTETPSSGDIDLFLDSSDQLAKLKTSAGELIVI